MINTPRKARLATDHELAVGHAEAVHHGDEESRDRIQEEALRRGISVPELEEIR